LKSTPGAKHKMEITREQREVKEGCFSAAHINRKGGIVRLK